MKTFSLAAVLSFLAALVLGTVLAAPALAHTALKSSDPKQNARVESLEKVTLEFTEPVRLPTVIVRGPGGTAYQTGEPTTDGPVVTQAMGGPLPSGDYTLAYRVVSVDGHPVEGEIPFTVAAPQPTASAAGVSSAPAAPPGTHTGHHVVPAASKEAQTPGIPAWVWVVVFGLAGVGIGLAISLRPKPSEKAGGPAMKKPS
jgi:methionine-rich copper-binding protein CopC